ncbi:MAG TPA: glycoside hydrolase family 2 TIM barrel-domain containing protein [Chitinophagaceae bacterium]|nr:glycoside hydrolase family 2 TIM barrel-domain containing protein [Chitinophagaceae bacterium]
MDFRPRSAVIILSLCILSLNPPVSAQRKLNFDTGWKFHLGDLPGAQQPAYPDKGWRQLNLPHDWSIEGHFSPDNPAGYGGGALPGGIGWYRKTFQTSLDTATRLSIEFDGVYMNSEVWINGHFLGNRPYGYSSFIYDLTPYLYRDSANVLAVRVDNSLQPNSRWYSGSGIYRHVWLIRTSSIHVANWGSYVTTPVAGPEQALVKAAITIRSDSDQRAMVTLVNTVLDPGGRAVDSFRSRATLPPDTSLVVSSLIPVSGPVLWSTDHPAIYTLRTDIYSGKFLLDRYCTPFGIRTIHFDPDKGFFLNGKPLKIRGVCDHHDLGCLGAALNDRALQRQLQLLQAAGVNAIRTSHNPPAPELLDFCDRMGILVMDEAFDCWELPKVKYDYHLYFDQWHKKDLQDMVRRDRNHPSVILWSIGNEIPEQGAEDGGQIARELSGIVKSLDTTRLVTSACNVVSAADLNGFAAALDIVGINYSISEYDQQKAQYPHRLFFGSETTSALSTRGVYHMPADKYTLKTPDMECSSYDNCWATWGSSAEEGWRAIRNRDFMAGMFIWTGFDYLGEPTPYTYPAHSSYFGFIDLCGFPKDAYYFYQSQWTSKPMVHLLPHWNWKPGQPIDIWAYTNCDRVSLFLNGKPCGVRSFLTRDQMHLAWRIPFSPGRLVALGYRDGKMVASDTVSTAGRANLIQLIPDRSILHCGGTDLSFLTVKVEDAHGVLVPDAENLIHFKVTGPGTIAGVDNGNEISLEPFRASQRKAFHGMCLVVIRTTDQPGKITLQATAAGLRPGAAVLESR